MVFHGTRQTFDSFSRIDGGNLLGPGYYFTESPGEASNYAVGKNVGRVTVDRGNPAVIPAMLSVQKPYELRKDLLPRRDLLALSRLSDPASPRELAKRFDRSYQATDWNVWSALIQDHGSDRTIEILRAAGYDGIRHGTQWVVFSPGQAKSSIGNSGKYDAKNPDLCDRDEPTPLERWMAGSVVVDDHGKPRPVYHGTGPEPFNVFEKRGGPVTTFIGSETVERHGFFFTDNPKFASEFARAKGANGRIVTAFLSLKKPLDLTNGFGPEILGDIERAGLNANYYADLPNDELWSMFDGENGKDTVAALKRMGYDGAIINEPDGARQTQRSYVVFEPNQIKSAIGNTGKFDPANPDIYDRDPIPTVASPRESSRVHDECSTRIRPLSPPPTPEASRPLVSLSPAD